MLYKSIISTILFIFITSFLNGQNYLIEGEVLSVDDQIINATIEYGSNKGVTTDSLGRFSIEITDTITKLKLKIRCLGYQELDTIIQIKNPLTSVSFYLEKNTYNQPEIVVTESAENIYSTRNWIILDVVLHHDLFYFLYRKQGKTYLKCTTLEGINIDEVILKNQHENLYISCSNRLYLLDKLYAKEITFNQKLRIGESYDINKFEAIIIPCIYKKETSIVQKKLTKHNKEISYINYKKSQQPYVFYHIYDKKAAKVASAYYRDIFRLYYRAVENPQKGAIDEGFGRINIVVEGSWDGDLKKLILNNKLHEAVSYYENVESRPIKTLEFVYEDDLYIVDYLDEKIITYPEDENVKELEINNFDWEKDYTILEDKSNGEIYCLDNNDSLFLLNLKDNDFTLKFIKKLEFNGYFISGIIIQDNTIFYYSQGHSNLPYHQFFQSSLD